MTAAARQLKVLLVEDNPHVADLIVDGLENAARRELRGQVTFAFDVCSDGRTALERVSAGAPDLIICDVYMPVMDGAMFLRHLRAKADATPVIALSAGGQGARESAMEAGANVFLDKPIRLTEVLRAALDLLTPKPA